MGMVRVMGKERAALARSSNPSQLSDEAADENIQYEVEDDGMPPTFHYLMKLQKKNVQ